MRGREENANSIVDLQWAIEQLPDPFFTLDYEGRFTYLNEATARFMKREAQDLLGRVFWQEFPDTLGTLIETNTELALRDGRAVRFETYFPPGGAWVDAFVQAHGDGVGVHLRDLSERRRDEERQAHLRLVTSRLMHAHSASDAARVLLTEGLATLDAVGGSVYALLDDDHLEALAFSGYEEQATHAWQHYRLHDSLPVTVAVRERRALFLDANADREAFSTLPFERNLVLAILPLHLDDTPLGVLSVSFPVGREFTPGERAYLLSLAQQGAQALHRSVLTRAQRTLQGQLDALLAHLPVGVLLARAPDAQVLAGNQRSAVVLGRHAFPGRANDHASWKGYHSSGRPLEPHEWPLVRAVQGETVRREDVLYERPDGEHRVLRFSAAPIHDERGIVHSAIAVVDDITQAQLNEQQLNDWHATVEHRVEERTQQLKRINEELDAFSYSVSHDLRTPLRHIRGFTHLLTRALHGQLPDNATQYLHRIERATEQMDSLVEALLEFARLGQKPLRARPVNLHDLAEAVREELMLDYVDRDVTWRIAVLPVVRGDAELLRQVFVNLFSNALKYTRVRAQASIEVDARLLGDEWVVSVRDNGVGFDERYADKLFGVFQRLHGTDEFEGTGIGLANVRRIVVRHGGRVWAQGEKGRGATFAFTLPAVREDT